MVMHVAGHHGRGFSSHIGCHPEGDTFLEHGLSIDGSGLAFSYWGRPGDGGGQGNMFGNARGDSRIEAGPDNYVEHSIWNLRHLLRRMKRQEPGD